MTTQNPNLPIDTEPVTTIAWRRFFRALLARAPVSGTATFVAETSVSVSLNPPLPDDQYNVLLDAPEDNRFWVTAKSGSGFTLNAGATTSATLGYTTVRR